VTVVGTLRVRFTGLRVSIHSSAAGAPERRAATSGSSGTRPRRRRSAKRGLPFDRPYSRAISFEAARDEVRRCAGTHFDPAVVDTFLGIPLELLAAIGRGGADTAAAPDDTEAAVRAVPGLARALGIAGLDPALAAPGS